MLRRARAADNQFEIMEIDFLCVAGQ